MAENQTQQQAQQLIDTLKELNRTTILVVETQQDLEEKYTALAAEVQANVKLSERQRQLKLKDLQQQKAEDAKYAAQRRLNMEKESKGVSGMIRSWAGDDIKRHAQALAAEAAMAELSKSFKTAVEITGQVALAFGSVAKSMAAGNAKFTDFTGVTDAAISGFKTLSKEIPIVGGALSATFTALGGAARISIDMLQMTSDMFENLGRTGLLGAAGMDGVKQQADLAGLSLKQFEKVTTANAGALANFGGTASQGAERFGRVMGSIMRDAGMELRMLGMSREQIGEVTTAFLAEQTRQGQQRRKSDSELAAGAARYAKQLDELSKLTGMQRQEMIDARQAALSETRFRSKIEAMKATGDQSQIALAEKFEAMNIALGPKTGVAQGFRDAITGIIGDSERAAEFIRLGGQQVIDALNTGDIDQAMRLFAEVIGQQKDTILSLGQANVEPFGRVAELMDTYNRVLGNAAREQQQQTSQTEGVSNKLVTAQDALDNLQKKIETLAFDGIGPMTTAVDMFTGALEKGVKILNDLLGLDGSKSEIWTAVGTAAGLVIGKAIGAILGSFLGGVLGAIKGFLMGGGPVGAAIGAAIGAAGGGTVGAAIGGAGGALAGGMAGARQDRRQSGLPPAPRRGLYSPRDTAAPGAGPSGDTAPAAPTGADLFAFQGGVTGNRANFDQLDPAFRERLVAMATEYYQKTNRKLPFGSGQRSAEANARVGGASRSLHMEGRAVDLSAAAVEELKAMGLLGTYGFRQNPRSGWHISDSGYQYGGIASGPASGYEALLHGIEAVVPLPDGKTIPVSFKNNLLPEIRNLLAEEISSMNEKVSTVDTAVDRMGEQFRQIMLDFMNQQRQDQVGPLLQELVNLQRGLNTTSERMLQVAQN